MSAATAELVPLVRALYEQSCEELDGLYEGLAHGGVLDEPTGVREAVRSRAKRRLREKYDAIMDKLPPVPPPWEG